MVRKPTLVLSDFGRTLAFIFLSIGVASTARMAGLLGRAERARPKAAQRRAEGAGLDGECAYGANIGVAAMRTMIGRCPQGTSFYTKNLEVAPTACSRN
jgi:hypothetical protein